MSLLLICLCTALGFLLCLSSSVNARRPDKKVIVLAAFGTAGPDALEGILNVVRKVEAAFPDTRVELAFTSRMIRNIWRKRRNDDAWRKKHQDIPESILRVKSPLATIADLEDEGFNVIIVQPLHIYAGEEFVNLKSYIDALNSIKTIKLKHQPFNRLVLGRPALGEPGVVNDYKDDMKTAVNALAGDVERARRDGSVLVYLGHGNNYMSSGIYLELEEAMRENYPDVHVAVGVVEGFPGVERVMKTLKHIGARNVTLVPLLLVVGDHAQNDMAGDDEDSWKSIMQSEGVRVDCVMRGLGELDEWADIYVRHIREVMEYHGIN